MTEEKLSALANEEPPSLTARILHRLAVGAAQRAFAAPEDPSSVAGARRAAGAVVACLTRDPSCLRSVLGLLQCGHSVFAHSVNTCLYATAVGVSLGLATSELRDLSLAAFLHDVGKARVPDEILDKPFALTPAEWEVMRRHPGWSAELLVSSGLAGPSLRAILQHHERLDGSGYPFGLRGAEVDPLARIVALADAYDALTSLRPYRAPLLPADALRLIGREAGERFDQDLYLALVRILGSGLPKGPGLVALKGERR